MVVPTTMGNPRAERRPSRAAMAARGKFGSHSTSGIQAAVPVAHTRPGSPSPGKKVRSRLVAANDSKAVGAADHVAAQRNTPARGSTSQRAPYSHPSASPTALRIPGTASA